MPRPDLVSATAEQSSKQSNEQSSEHRVELSPEFGQQGRAESREQRQTTTAPTVILDLMAQSSVGRCGIRTWRLRRNIIFVDIGITHLSLSTN